MSIRFSGSSRKSGVVGGVSSFERNLYDYFLSKGEEVAELIEKTDVLFCSSFVNFGEAGYIKNRGGKIIQRLDGVAVNDVSLREKIEKTYSYSDLKIFQSEYSWKLNVATFGEISSSDYLIIRNGANKNIFKPSTVEKRKTSKIIFGTTASFRKKEQIKVITDALDSLEGQFEFELRCFGPVKKAELEPFFDRSYIVNYGSLSHVELARELQQLDAFVHAHPNDNCPNAVIEAISCGIPVLGFEAGALPELCFFNAELLGYVSDDLYKAWGDYDPLVLADKIKLFTSGQTVFENKAMANSHLYDFSETGKLYYESYSVLKQKAGRDRMFLSFKNYMRFQKVKGFFWENKINGSH